MIIIQKNPTWLKDGAIVLTREEREAIVHALADARRQMVPGQLKYGYLSVEELEQLTEQLREMQ